MIRGTLWDSHQTSTNSLAAGRWKVSVLLEDKERPQQELKADQRMVVLTEEDYKHLLNRAITGE